MPKVYLLLGSNQGQKKKTINTAIAKINEVIGEVLNKSALYETAAWGKTDQASFINQTIELKTRKYPKTIMKKCLEIESELGRKRYGKWAARTIDIDILFYGNKIIKEKNLVIPHKEFINRNFAMVPMVEIAPKFIHPDLGITMEACYNQSTDNLSVRKLNG